MNVPFIWQCQPFFDKEIIKGSRNIIIYYIWFFDKIGWALERTPLVIFFSGFWSSIFIKRAIPIFNAIESGKIGKEEGMKKAKRLDICIYSILLLSCAIIFFGLFVPIIAQVDNEMSSYNFWTKSTVSVILGILLGGLIHEIACPSCMRLWKHALDKEENEVAEIINRASPSISKYIEKKF